MKNLLIATTALVATAGMASAEITFSGKGEAGMYRTGKADAVALKYGLKTAVGGNASTGGIVTTDSDGNVVVTAATGVAADADATTVELLLLR